MRAADDGACFGGAPSDDDCDGDIAATGAAEADAGLPDEDAMYTAASWVPGEEPPEGPSQALASTYEERCRALVEASIAAAASSEVRTALTVRVAAWQSRIGPFLEAQDARPPFNIQECAPLPWPRLPSCG